MINICEYGVDSVGVWLLRTMEFMFWFYVALSTVASAGMYLILWSTLSVPLAFLYPRQAHQINLTESFPSTR